MPRIKMYTFVMLQRNSTHYLLCTPKNKFREKTRFAIIQGIIICRQSVNYGHYTLTLLGRKLI